MKAIIERIQSLIISLPGRPDGMFAKDLAKIYQVKTGRLNEAVKRNKNKFPDDFMFQVTDIEQKFLLSQNAISQQSPALTYIFTQYGANQLSSILRSDIAVKRSIQIMRAFTDYNKKESLPTNYIEALEQLVISEKQKVLALEEIEKQKKVVKKQTRKIKKDRPKVKYYDKVLDSKSDFTITQIAKQVEMTAHSLNTVLEQSGVQFKQSGQWLLKQQYQDRGLVNTRTHIINNGRQVSKQTSHSTVWTEKGREFILDLLENI